MSVLSPPEMDLAAAVFAVTAFVVADLDAPLARNDSGDDDADVRGAEQKGEQLTPGLRGVAVTASV